jgi:hypothetical protein
MLALVGILYLAKAAVIRQRTRPSIAILWFVLLLALAVPVTWAADTDWNNPHVYQVGIWVGTPVAFLAVPAASFAADLWTLARRGRPRSAWWYLPEVLIVFPVWVYYWAFFSFYILGWGWI